MKSLYFLLSLFFFSFSCFSQSAFNYYLVKDFTGLENLHGDLSALSQKAEEVSELVNVPSEQDSFQVHGISTYPILRFGDASHAMTSKIEHKLQLESEHNYFLAFFKQIDTNNNPHQISEDLSFDLDVWIKLPDLPEYNKISASNLITLRDLVLQTYRSVFTSSGRANIKAEKAAMDVFIHNLNKLVDDKQIGDSPEELLDLLSLKDFAFILYKIEEDQEVFRDTIITNNKSLGDPLLMDIIIDVNYGKVNADAWVNEINGFACADITTYKYPRDQGSISFDENTFVFVNLDEEYGILAIKLSIDCPTVRSGGDPDLSEVLEELKTNFTCWKLLKHRVQKASDICGQAIINIFPAPDYVVRETNKYILKNSMDLNESKLTFGALHHQEYIYLHYSENHTFHLTSYLKAYYKLCSKLIHTALDVCSLIDGVSIPCDVANFILYATDGEYGQAGLAALAAVPLLGYVSSTAKNGDKIIEVVQEVEGVKRTFISRIINGIVNWGYRGKLAAINKGYRNFSGNGLNFQKHHLITWNIAKTNPHSIVKRLSEAGWHVSRPLNGVKIPKKFDRPKPNCFHGCGGDKKYDKVVRQMLDEVAKKSDDQLYESIDVLEDYLSKKIQKAFDNGVSLNNYFDKNKFEILEEFIEMI